MGAYRSILLIADHSLAQPSPAMRRAVCLALASGAELHMCLFEHSAGIEAVGHIHHEIARLAREAYVRERGAWLEGAADSMPHEGLAIRTSVVWGAPQHRRVLDCIRNLRPDLVVKDVHLEPALRRLAPGPLDWRCCACARCR